MQILIAAAMDTSIKYNKVLVLLKTRQSQQPRTQKLKNEVIQVKGLVPVKI